MNTYKIGVKQRSRKAFRKFISSSSVISKPASEINVLCLPGKEALEITEVYDKLGIPRRNIVCLEYNKENYEELNSEAAAEGCLILNMSLEGFLQGGRKHFRKFDILSLDFTGHFGTYSAQIGYLVSNLFSRDGVLLTNFAGAREGKKTQEQYGRLSDHASSLDLRDRPGLSEGLHAIVEFSSDKTPVREALRRAIRAKDYEGIGDELKKKAGSALENFTPYEIGGPILNALHSHHFGREIRKHESYRYTSTGGTNMLVDIFHATKTKLPFLKRANVTVDDSGSLSLQVPESDVVEIVTGAIFRQAEEAGRPFKTRKRTYLGNERIIFGRFKDEPIEKRIAQARSRIEEDPSIDSNSLIKELRLPKWTVAGLKSHASRRRRAEHQISEPQKVWLPCPIPYGDLSS